MRADTVYVVHDIYILGKNLHEIYADEMDALREATTSPLPQGVLRRSVTPKVVK
jgi:hypothetical protein